MDPAQIYSFKVWLTMLIFAPALQMSAAQVFFHSGNLLSVNFITAYPLAVLVLLVVTAPLGALLTFCITRLSRSLEAHEVKQKVSSAIGIATVLIFAGASIPQNSYTLVQLGLMILPYTVSLMLGIWMCSIDLELYGEAEEAEEEEAS
jgi:hypothetical protein